MRCGCPECGQFMVHRESALHLGCVCPSCGFTCVDCLGTNFILSKEDVMRLKQGEQNVHVQDIQEDFSKQKD